MFAPEMSPSRMRVDVGEGKINCESSIKWGRKLPECRSLVCFLSRSISSQKNFRNFYRRLRVAVACVIHQLISFSCRRHSVAKREMGQTLSLMFWISSCDTSSNQINPKTIKITNNDNKASHTSGCGANFLYCSFFSAKLSKRRRRKRQK